MFERLFGSRSKVADTQRVEPVVAAPVEPAGGPMNLHSSASVEEWQDFFGFLGNDMVTRESAMKLTAVIGCVSLLGGTIGTMPVRVMKSGDNGGSEEHKDHDVNWLVRHEPHEDYTTEVFFEGMGVLSFLEGNGCAEIIKTRRGDPIGLRPILEGTCKPFERKGGRIAYRITENGDTYGRDKDDILHFRGSASMSRFKALSPLKCFGRTIGIGLEADEYARLFYKQGGTPSGYITYDGKVDEKIADEVRQYWMRKMSGVQNAHLPAVLAEGGKFVSLMQDPETAQLMQSRSFQVSDVARAFGVPPHLIGETEKSTSWGTGINAQTTQFYILGLRKHVKRFEGELTRKLLTRSERAQGTEIKFNLDTLLRADLAARYDAPSARFWLENPFYQPDQAFEMTIIRVDHEKVSVWLACFVPPQDAILDNIGLRGRNPRYATSSRSMTPGKPATSANQRHPGKLPQSSAKPRAPDTSFPSVRRT